LYLVLRHQKMGWQTKRLLVNATSPIEQPRNIIREALLQILGGFFFSDRTGCQEATPSLQCTAPWIISSWDRLAKFLWRIKNQMKIPDHQFPQSPRQSEHLGSYHNALWLSGSKGSELYLWHDIEFTQVIRICYSNSQGQTESCIL
jgi:hypothetical protein